MEKISISSEYIKLDQFLKWSGVADSGVVAKDMILSELVKVNGEIEIRRGKKLYPGDTVEVLGQKFIVE
ncbi:MAG: RNA-binding S4 domain-containing protein [Cetobacterium sp.]|uniref:RNA-binding S4 domain-containing protein n=1 Tax=unclassified Cetobacterium TaxID=2630983 RepID=UPI00163CC093|nr:RNA-binding S4 domain-containing protein [Cetobacterium sp. 2A]MBC2856222.1 RNA-binding S4 domain-containing protein [Cetobacterium sp. 2A]